MDDSYSRINFGCLHPEVMRIVTCLQRLNCITDSVVKCLDGCGDNDKKEILFCMLLNRLESLENHALSCETDSVRACGAGIDGVTRTLRTDANNVLATLPSAAAQSQIGRMFSGVLEFQLTNATSNAALVITNPSGSGRIMYLDSIFAGNRFSGSTPEEQFLSYRSAISITVLRGTSAGTALPAAQNLNFGSAGTSAMALSRRNDPPNGFTIARTINVFGHISLDFSGKIIVPPGTSAAVWAFAQGPLGDDLIDGAFTVTWYELDAPAA